MENTKILTVAIAAVQGKIGKEFASGDQTSDALRNAFIELNGGSTKLNPKTFHRGNALFEIVEELIPTIIDEGIKTDSNPLFAHVDYRNIADGDTAEFCTEGISHFVVASAAAGLQGVRRQRIVGGETVKVTTEMKLVRVYENLQRLLAGRIDFNKFVDGVAKAFKDYIADAAYAVINGLSAATSGLDSTYVKSGSYAEDTLLGLIDHVEAATGKVAKIIGTRTALRKITEGTVADSAKEDMYALGYYGKFNGTEMICMKQAHKPGTSTFALNDSKVWVVAGDDKFVKVVNEGEGLLVEREATTNNDLTQEYVYGQGLGVGAICAEKIGVYSIS